MSIAGVHRTENTVDGIDYFKCAKVPYSTGTINCGTVAFPDDSAWPKCPAKQVMTGIHTDCGLSFNCINALVCCDNEIASIHTVPPKRGVVDWESCMSNNEQCDSPPVAWLSGFYQRYEDGCDNLDCITGAYAQYYVLASDECPAPSSGVPCKCDDGYIPYGNVQISPGIGSCCPIVSQGVTTPTGIVTGELITAATHTGASGLELAGIPEYLQGTEGFFPVNVVDETTFSLDCCGTECTFFVAVYHCSPCSQDRNGKLIAELLGKGWEGSSCAPKFVLDSRGYPMTILHKTTTDSLQLKTEGPTDFIAIFKKEGGVTSPLCPKSQGPSVPAGGCNTHCAP